jgi:hypothetical protein
VGVGTWTKIGLNDTDYNDQGAFDAGNNRFVAPVDGTYLFGATRLYKVNASTSARMSGRLVLNGTTGIRGSRGEISGAHVSEATALLAVILSHQAGSTGCRRSLLVQFQTPQRADAFARRSIRSSLASEVSLT